ncbi:unnamed protein product [Cladocopium goreaui]|uniref:Uncharacterized protein n=1 Tax=Cladocopium goreaui TaxID=2562237 RepID=A0A9P1FI72_9DINO|nr:unnamed protein product [Cladocopium goreaui]CAI3987234.1 unnamed protein product [Cladocopium goreaui]CAI4010665.1 unnamed protein product [Cladocopium goreaui]
MLNFGAEYGLKGYIEPDRFLTDANKVGVEKLAVSAVKPEMLTTQPVRLASFDHGDLLGPMSVFLVKGWSRCVAAVVLLLYAYESPEDVFQAWACAVLVGCLQSLVILSIFLEFEPVLIQMSRGMARGTEGVPQQAFA